MKEILGDLPRGFTVVSEDESFFTYDSLVRKVWIEAGRRPVVTMTGSHRRSRVMGALSLDGRQLFRKYDWFNEDTFYEYLKVLHRKFPKCYLVLDKANPLAPSPICIGYFAAHPGSLIPVWLPTASPEFMVLEECWKLAKGDLQVLKYYSSFAEFKDAIGTHFRTARFDLDMRNYLVGKEGLGNLC